ncbi:MAG: hypothetical protein H8E14_15710 [Candidatus Marinimicrobia bacterium]|nr:hypothetical protein [Candidatus Neomarinimicrobiota bacterium]
MDQLIITTIIILIPGITATIIYDKLTVHSNWSQFKFGLYSFFLGVLVYFALQIIYWVCDIISYFWTINFRWSQLDIWKFIDNSNLPINTLEVFFASLVSIPVAYFASFIINNKIITKVGQKLKVTDKYGDENLFSYYLTAKQINWVYIRDIHDGLTYQGQVTEYSENDEIQEIVLSDVTVFRYKDSEKLYSVPSIYLAKKTGNFIIEAIPEEILKEN